MIRKSLKERIALEQEPRGHKEASQGAIQEKQEQEQQVQRPWDEPWAVQGAAVQGAALEKGRGAGDEVGEWRKEATCCSNPSSFFTYTFSPPRRLSVAEVTKSATTCPEGKHPHGLFSSFLRSSYVWLKLSLIVRKLTPDHFKMLKCWRRPNPANWHLIQTNPQFTNHVWANLH